jgi:hypothetical protein
MEATSATPDDSPEEDLAGKKIDTATAFGGTAVLAPASAPDTESRMSDISTPSEDGDSSTSGPDETLQQILKGEVPKSGPAS